MNKSTTVGSTPNTTNIQIFLKELTEISFRFGLAITGAPFLFLLEPEDYDRCYRVDATDRINFS